MYPSLEKHISKNILRYAINMEYNSKNPSLQENDEIAVFHQWWRVMIKIQKKDFNVENEIKYNKR